MERIRIEPINIEEFRRKCDEVYEKLKPELEEKYHGKVVAIVVDTGDYFVGESVSKAGALARAKHPGKLLYFVRPGYDYVWRIH